MKKSFRRDFIALIIPRFKLKTIQITAFLLCLFAFLFSENLVNGQSTSRKVSLNVANTQLVEVVKSIAVQSGTSITYNEELLSPHKITIRVANVTALQALKEALKGLPLDTDLVNNRLVVFQKRTNTAWRDSVNMNANQPRRQSSMSGTVTDTLGNPLSGVSVSVLGYNTSASTDGNGNYRIELPSPQETIVFSLIGYESSRIEPQGRQSVNVVLSPAASELDEVVVVGFGTQRKITLTGSVASVQTKELKQSAVSNLSSALVGRLPGLIARNDTGEPGASGSSIWLRGQSTYSGGNGPLIMVDGVPRDGFGFIDPNEVESITILKDASSTAVYGVRGANGVVLVTTKRGQSLEKPTVEFNMERAIQTPTRLPEYLNAMDFFRYHRMGLINDGKLAEAEKYTNEYIARYDQSKGWLPDLEYGYLYPNVDWMNEMLKDASGRLTANVNVSGGTSKTRYFLSGSYFTEDGIYNHEDAVENYNIQAKEQRFNFRSNIDLEISKWFKAELGLATIVRNRNYPFIGSQDFFTLLKSTPSWATPIFNPDGSFGEMRDQNNPYAQLTGRGYKRMLNSYLQGTVGVTANLGFLLDGLSARARFSYDATSNGGYNRETSYWSYLYQGEDRYERIKTGQDFLNYALANDYWAMHSNPEFYLNYQRNFAKHNVSGMFLYRLTSNSIRSGNAIGALPQREQGVVGRFTYGYDDKYFAEANFGYNGSENFAPGQRWGFFPSVSVGWAINKEDFLKDVEALQLLKVRLSHGKVGNQDPGTRFAYQSRWNLSAGGYSFGENYDNTMGGAIEGVIGNQFVTWETAKMTNLGIDFLLHKNLLEVTADAFYERRTGIFTESTRVTSGLIGIPSESLPTLNAGVVENKGFEVDIKHIKAITDNFSYHVRANYTFAKNKILDYLESPVSDRPWQMRRGRQISEIITHEAEGYFQSEEDFNNYPTQTGYGAAQPGDIRYRDINGDNIIDDYDRTYTGRLSEPNQILGFAGGINYKGFDVSFLFQGGFGRYVFIDGNTLFGNQYAFRNIMADLYGNSWTPENRDAKYPRPMSMNTHNNTMKSTHWLQNANYVRLKNVEIGYVLPNTLTKRFGVGELRVYVNGNNLYTWDTLKLFDPEEANGSPKYPLVRTFNGGIKVKF